MSTKRIRCSCGRVYDPDQFTVCPGCGTSRIAASPAVPEPEEDEEKPDTRVLPRRRREEATPPPPNSTVLWIAVGAFVVMLITAFLVRGGRREQPVPRPAPEPTPISVPAPIPTPAPLATPTPQRKASLHDQLQDASESNTSRTDQAPAGQDLAALIEKTPPGGTLKLPPGTYAGPIVLSRPIHLVGDAKEPGQVTIQSAGANCVSVKSPDVSATNIRFVCSGIGQLATITVAEGAALELIRCTVHSPTSFGVLVPGQATFTATGSTFNTPQGTGVRLDRGGQGTLTQCTFLESRYSFFAGAGSRLSLHSCSLQRNGDDSRGILFSMNGQGTEVTADDCQFVGNTAGAVIGQRAVVKITNSQFRDNGPVQGGPKTVEGLLSVRFGARAIIIDNTFENNRQGIYIADGSSLEMRKCQLIGNGVAGQQLIPGAFPLSVSGQGTVATVAGTTIASSPQYAAEVRGGARLELDDVDFKGNRDVALIVGDRNSPPATAEIKRSRFQRNLSGTGVFGGSSATISDSEYTENRQGVLIFDRGTQVSASATQFVGNIEVGLRAFDGAQATASDCTFQNNSIGVLSGTKNTPAGRASITLIVCRFSGNRLFATGAAEQSELILRTCLFDGTDKQNVLKERGANVQIQSNAIPGGR